MEQTIMIQSTSIAAYNKLIREGKLRGIQRMIFNVLAHDSKGEAGMTANEIANIIRITNLLPAKTQIDSIRPRFAEMQRRGLIEPKGERLCLVTQERAIIWVLTGEEPRKMDKRGSGQLKVLRQEIERLNGIVNQLQNINDSLKAKLSRWGRPSNANRAERNILENAIKNLFD